MRLRANLKIKDCWGENWLTFSREKMSGKGAKGLIMGKGASNNKDKDKKKPTSRSSRAGLQVISSPSILRFRVLKLCGFLLLTMILGSKISKLLLVMRNQISSPHTAFQIFGY